MLISCNLISETERRIKIFDYMWEKSLDKNPKITKSDIMRHLKDSRPMTTHKLTIDLIKEGKIKMVKPKDKPYSQIDYLVINEENEFNKIYNSFLEIEKMLEIISDAGLKTVPEDLRVVLLNAYISSTTTLVDFLLVMIDTKIRSEKDALILYKKAINLMGKIHTNQYLLLDWTSEINNRISGVEISRSWLKEQFEEVPPYVNKWFDDIIDLSKLVKKRFLSETEQRTTEPHEKSG